MLSFDFPPLTTGALLGALFIFALRVFGITISTIRVLVMMRGKKAAAFAFGFIEVLAYVVAIAEVVNNLDNIWNVLGYCLGFSVGTVVGMIYDERGIDRLNAAPGEIRARSPRLLDRPVNRFDVQAKSPFSCAAARSMRVID